MRFPWTRPDTPRINVTASATPRRPKRMAFSWDGLEERVVMSHGGFQPQISHVTAHVSNTGTSGTTGTTTSTAVQAAREALEAVVVSIEEASGTTVGDLATIRADFRTLAADGLTPSSQSALTSFENGLVTQLAAGTLATNAASNLTAFEALYTSTPTAQETTDLTAAYNALATAVTHSNITAANITAINTAYSNLLAAEGNTSSTATYPYFNLVTGQGGGPGGGGFGGGCH